MNLTMIATAITGSAAAGLALAALLPALPLVAVGAAVAGFVGTMYAAPKIDARAKAKHSRTSSSTATRAVGQKGTNDPV
jgi:hypothetical protein